MFGRANFRDCITDNLKSKGYGKERAKEILDIFERRVKEHDRSGLGHPAADYKAMEETYAEVAYAAREKIKRANHNIEVLADVHHRVAQGFKVSTSGLVGDRGAGLSGSQGVGVARGIASVLQADPRFSGLDFQTVRNSYHNKYVALLGDALDYFAKGAFGVQKNVQHLTALVDELFGVASGDSAAKAFADAFRKLQKVMVSDFNAAGGSLRYLDTFVMPQKQSMAKLLKAGKQKWVADHLDWIDWNKTVYPNGDLIEAADRQGVLEAAYDTLSSGGANKIKPNAMHGNGSSVGNQLEKDRFLIFKGSREWLGMHEAYGDGNVFDVTMDHLKHMASQTAQVKMFGTSPSLWINTAKAVALKEIYKAQKAAMDAGDKSAKVKTMRADFDSGIRRVEDMFTATLHQNSMDPHSTLGAVATTTSNLLSAAQLSGAVVMAVPGDMFTKSAVSVLNGSGFSLGLSTYLKGMSPGGYGNLERMMARSGFVFDETISTVYSAERFSGLNTYAAPISRRIGDVTLRASGLNRHTNAARATAQLEQMGMLVEYADKQFSELPFRKVFDRYGITEADWNAVRKMQPTSPDGGNATFIRPIDILSTDLKNKDELYRKFFGFVDQESRYMVPASTVEASIVAKGVTRPDTLAGLILHSFAMYKNYPLSFAMTYGRLALAQPDKLTRVGFIASMALGMTLVGATGVQIRELTKGRTPLPMDDPKFWAKAFVSGGAAGILGDFLYSGTTEYGRGPAAQAGGPVVGFASDAVNLTFGTGFKWAAQADAGDPFNANLAARSLEFAKRYAPGSSMWWGRLALEREMWDRLQEMVDPKMRQKWRAKVRKQNEEFGNTYWSAPGQGLTGN